MNQVGDLQGITFDDTYLTNQGRHGHLKTELKSRFAEIQDTHYSVGYSNQLSERRLNFSF